MVKKCETVQQIPRIARIWIRLGNDSTVGKVKKTATTKQTTTTLTKNQSIRKNWEVTFKRYESKVSVLKEETQLSEISSSYY